MAMKARYEVINGEVIAEKRGGVRRLIVPDPLGSTVSLLDNTQAQTDTFAYWPYGEVRTRTGSTATPFQFVGTLGYYRDSASQTYVRARFLDTAKGRWMTVDPIGFRSHDANLYRYAYNSPMVWRDRSGTNCGKYTDFGNLHWQSCTGQQLTNCKGVCGLSRFRGYVCMVKECCEELYESIRDGTFVVMYVCSCECKPIT